MAKIDLNVSYNGLIIEKLSKKYIYLAYCTNIKANSCQRKHYHLTVCFLP